MNYNTLLHKMKLCDYNSLKGPDGPKGGCNYVAK